MHGTTVPRRLAATVFVAFAAATLQAQHEPDPELPALRDAFAAVTAGKPARPLVAIAVVGEREPVVLCAGEGVTPVTPLPIGPLVRLLLADALAVDKQRLGDQPSGITVAGRPRTVGELVRGVDDLPDYYDYEGGAPVDPVLLLRCAEVLEAAGEGPFCTTGGAGELLLLEPKLFAGGTPADARAWAGWLRVRLAPHVSGLAPVAADELDGDDAAPVRSASPAALRLLLTGKELAEWWRWRLRGQQPATGPRLGSETGGAREGITWWKSGHDRGPVTFAASVVPAQRSGLLLLGIDQRSRGRLERAFDVDLLGPEPEVARLGGRAVGRPKPPLREFVGTWKTAPGATPCTIEIADGDATSLRISWGERTAGSLWAQMQRANVRVGLGEVDGLPSLLSLVPGPPGEPRRCTAVLQERSTGAALPHCFELVRDGG